MEAILVAVLALTPLQILLSIFGGVVFGWVFKDIRFDAITIYLSLLYVTAFSIGRVIFVGVAGNASGAGLLGTILFVIYVISTLVTRKILRRNKS